ncbi:hypothetical protein Tco_0281573 [Tanacetum coccineum]
MTSMNTRLNIEKIDGNIVQKHGGSKQVGLKQLGSKQVQDEKHVWFEVKLQGTQRDHEAEIFQVSNDDTAVAQRQLKDKQSEEKTNTDCLVKEQENVHLGIKVRANIIITRVPGQEGAEGNVAENKKGAQGDHEAEVFQVSNDDTAVAQRRLKDKQPEEKTNTDCLVKEQENVHLGIKVGGNIMVTRVPGQEGAEAGPRFEVPTLDEDAEYRLCLSVTPKTPSLSSFQQHDPLHPLDQVACPPIVACPPTVFEPLQYHRYYQELRFVNDKVSAGGYRK